MQRYCQLCAPFPVENFVSSGTLSPDRIDPINVWEITMEHRATKLILRKLASSTLAHLSGTIYSILNNNSTVSEFQCRYQCITAAPNKFTSIA